MVMAVAAMKAGQVERIILTRPAVEQAKVLASLLVISKEKVDPHLRPVLRRFICSFGERTHRIAVWIAASSKIAPLAYMRGRMSYNAFAILDEAQNTTQAQMKMLPTRPRFGLKMIVNGDATQIYLPHNAKNGLLQAEQLLKGISHIAFTQFSAQDVVRHPVVAQIIELMQDHLQLQKQTKE